MGRVELVFIGSVLGVLIACGLILFAQAMIEIGKSRASKTNKKKGGEKNK